MSEKKKNKIVPQPQRPNYQMWVILGLVAIVFGVTFFKGAGDPIEVEKRKFEDMVQSHDIRKLTVIKNMDLVEITLTEDALKNSKYRTDLEKKNQWGINPMGPHYVMKIGSTDQFDRYYTGISERLPRDQRVDPEYENRSDMTSIL